MIKDPEAEYTMYFKHKEDMPTDTPMPLRKIVVLTHYLDTIVLYGVLSRKTVTGVPFYSNPISFLQQIHL